jgi:hypothetical protein
MTLYSFSRPVCLSPLVLALALAGCAKNTSDSQNPDSVAGDGTADGTADPSTDGASATPSKARGSTATRSGGRNTKARTITAKKPARAPKPAASPNGLFVTAFKFGGDSIPEDLSTLGEPLETFEVPNLDVDDTDVASGFPGAKGLTENYLLQFKGSINVVEEAEYELCLHSDDGSQLLLEGMLVVDNDGVHAAAIETCELLYLAPGEYVLEVRYFQLTGPTATMHMAWAINSGEKVIVPTEVLFKPAAG